MPWILILMPNYQDKSVGELKGLGPKSAKMLNEIGIITRGDLGPVNTNFEPAPEAIFSRNKAH